MLVLLSVQHDERPLRGVSNTRPSVRGSLQRRLLLRSDDERLYGEARGWRSVLEPPGVPEQLLQYHLHGGADLRLACARGARVRAVDVLERVLARQRLEAA